MNFPTPQQFLHFASSPSPTVTSFRDAPQDLSDERQWEKFDDLFDQVFAPAQTDPQYTSRRKAHETQKAKQRKAFPGFPGGFIADGSPQSGNSSADDMVDDFSGAWKDALKRTQKTVTTTTQRRIIRHTPPKTEMPTPPPRSRYPKTPYPNSDDEPGSSDSDMPGTPAPMPSGLARQLAAPQHPPSNLNSSPPPSASSQVVKFRPQKPKAQPKEPEWVTATFDMPVGLSKNDIQVDYSMAYGAEKATVSWQHITTEEIVENGRLIREKKERRYHRSLPLPRGTKFENVKAFLQDGVLTLVYPSRPGADLAAPKAIEVLQLLG